MGEAVEDSKADPTKKKLFLGQHGPSIWRDQMEIGNPVRDGLSMCLKFFFVFILFNGMHSPRFRSHRTIDISCFSGCHALQRFRASYSGHWTRMEYNRESRANGWNYVWGIPSSCVLHCQHRSPKLVSRDTILGLIYLNHLIQICCWKGISTRCWYWSDYGECYTGSWWVCAAKRCGQSHWQPEPISPFKNRACIINTPATSPS